MPNAVVTQTATLALANLEAERAAVTQAAVLALAGPAADAQVTQSVALALTKEICEARVTQAALLVMHRQPAECATQLVQCWKITRRDGQVFAFTTGSAAVTYGGTTYQPCDSLRASAVSGSADSGGGSTGDVQLVGILSDAKISERDLYAGRFDGASVVVHLVDWDTGIGRVLTRGIVSRTELRETGYTMTALTGGARLAQQPLLEVYSPLCRYEFGDNRCGFYVEALRVTGSVTAVTTANVVNTQDRRMFRDSARIETEATFRNGRLTWTTGDNAGLTFEVKTCVAGLITLWNRTPFTIALGDSYSMVPGCGKTKVDCITRFNNYENFGGFPDLPGTDSIDLTPD